VTGLFLSSPFLFSVIPSSFLSSPFVFVIPNEVRDLQFAAKCRLGARARDHKRAITHKSPALAVERRLDERAHPLIGPGRQFAVFSFHSSRQTLVRGGAAV
jgi:hypothetical protein